MSCYFLYNGDIQSCCFIQKEDLISFAEFCFCFTQNKILNIKNKTTKTKATGSFSVFGPPSCLQKRVYSI